MANFPEGYTCRTCGQSHSGLPFSFAANFPDLYANLKEEERDVRAVAGSDQCIVDSKYFFLRGLLEIPVIGNSEPFLWGVWASVLENVFDEVSASWELAGREKNHGPYRGRLANSLPIYPETLNLKLAIVLQPVGSRPLFTIEDSSHPLGMQQQAGITQEEANELASLLLHLEGRTPGHC